MPAQADIQPDVQPLPSAIAQISTPESSHSSSFFQKQRDKLKYSPDAIPPSLNFSFSQKRNSSIQPAQPKRAQTTQTLDSAILQEEKTKRENIGQKTTISERRSNNKLEDTTYLRDKLKFKFELDPGEHRNPLEILAAAKENHSPLQGRHLDFESLSMGKIKIKKPELVSLKQQLPKKIDQLKAELHTRLQRQPEQLKRTVAATKADLQKRSEEIVSNPLNSNLLSGVKEFVQRNIKTPLSRVLRRIGIAAQETAEQLEQTNKPLSK
ncbi:MAG: hypothetical protein AAF635_06585 [Cyanobacteria bacterium P01_C01_bin.69]